MALRLQTGADEHRTHQVLPLGDGFAELLEYKRRPGLREIRIFSDDEVLDCAHSVKAGAEAQHLLVPFTHRCIGDLLCMGRERRGSSCPARSGGGGEHSAIVDSHVEDLQAGTHADDVTERLERALDPNGPHPAAKLGVRMERVRQEARMACRPEGDLTVVQRGCNAEPCLRDEQRGDAGCDQRMGVMCGGAGDRGIRMPGGTGDEVRRVRRNDMLEDALEELLGEGRECGRHRGG